MSSFADLHAGQRCFVIASGPSINEMDLAPLRHEVTICVNQAYKALDYDPTYICIGDRELWPRIKDTYAKMKSTVICSTGLNGQVGSDYYGRNMGLVVPLDKRKSVSDGHFRHDLVCVYKAFNVIPETVLPFVLHAGFADCYVIGCDCTDDGYFYPESQSARANWKQAVLPETLRAYGVIARYARANELTRIRNAGYGGRLEAFERVEFGSLFPAPPLVIGYHTPHVEYRELAARMKASVESFGLECIVREYPARGNGDNPHHMNWVLNCAICGEFIRDMQAEFPDRDLVYLDADAVMRKRPGVYLNGPRDFDFAAPYLDNAHVTNELQSNSLYFAATKASRTLVSEWIAEQARRTARLLAGGYLHPYRPAWDQQVLQDVLPRIAGLRSKRLPLTYGKIMPTPTGYEITPDVPLEDAVITQHQASRKMRRLV